MKIFLIVATTIDGQIAQTKDQVSTGWTSREDATWFRERTKQAGVCVMGRTTYDTVGRPLPGRTVIVQTSKPELLSKVNPQITVLDSKSNWQRQSEATEVLATNLQIPELIKKLSISGVEELAICGGASVYTAWLKSGYVETLYITQESKLFGRGVSLLTDEVDIQLDLVSSKQLGSQTLLNEYRVKTG